MPENSGASPHRLIQNLMLKTEITGPEGGLVRTQDAVVMLSDNGRDARPGNQGQTASTHGE